MLNRKNMIALIAVLAVLLLVSLVQQRRHEQVTSRSSSDQLLAGPFTSADLGRIEIGYGASPDAVVLTQGPSGWVVTTSHDAKASTQKIDSLLGTLSELRGEYRSETADVLPDYGFTDSTTVHLVGLDKSGQQVFALEVGDKPSQGTGNFVRLPDDAKVYLTSAGILGNLGLYSGPALPTGRQFLDLQVVTCDRKDVDAITLQDGKQTVHLEKQFTTVQPAADDTTGAGPTTDRANWEWQITRPKKSAVAKTKADAVLNSLCNLRAQDVADPSQPLDTYGLQSPAKVATLTKQDGSTVTVAFGATRAAEGGTPGGVYAQVAGEATVWIVAEYQLKSIFKSPDDLKPAS